jgi:hypothetical protein
MRAILRPDLFLRIFFCPHQAQDLRQIRAAPNLTTRQSAAKLAVCVEVCAQAILDSRHTRRRNATSHLCQGVRAHHCVCDIEKAGLRARVMRYCSPPIGRSRRHNTIVDEPVMESELSFVSHLKDSLSIASRGASRIGDLPKTCHLLPSNAIL